MRVVKEFVLIVRYFFSRVVASLLSLFFKSQSFVVFGAMGGRYLGDNSYPMYLEWIKSGREGYWSTSSLKIYRELSEKGLPVLFQKKASHVLKAMRARALVITNSLFDIYPDPGLASDSARIFNMRHGRSPKKVRFARENHKIGTREGFYRKRESKLTAAVASTSPWISGLQEKCLLLGDDKHVVVGYPRNDQLIREAEKKSGDDGKKVILYAPTWRHGRSPTLFFPFEDNDFAAFDEFLENNDAEIWMRPHAGELKSSASQRERLKFITGQSTRIRLATHEEYPDVNAILPSVNVLISDYSALIHDFLLLDRPVIIVPYDYADFKEKNGFLYDPVEFASGPIVESADQMLSALEKSMEDSGFGAEKRHAICDRVFTHKDARSTERALLTLQEMMNHE